MAGDDADGADGRAGWRRAADRLVDASATERIVISVAALALSIVVGWFIVFFSGMLASCEQVAYAAGPVKSCYQPTDTYNELFLSSFRRKSGLAILGKETTLLVFTGLSVAVAFRAGMFNIGTQGQLVVGALVSAVAAVAAGAYVPPGPLGTVVLLPLTLLAGALAGGIYGAIPGALKAYAEANEVITTIMLNFVATKLALVATSEFFQDPESFIVRTNEVPGNARFPVVPGIGFQQSSDFSILVLVAGLTLVGAIYYLLTRTSFGYDVRASGVQPEAAEYGGVPAERTMVLSMALSGAIGGIGGAVWVLMVTTYFQTGVPAFGFDGITVSILAGNNPLGVSLAALLFGTLKAGSLSVDVNTPVPKELVGVLRGLIILFVAMPEFFRMAWARTGWESGGDDGAVAADGGGADE
jgi:simple sugar transport system permease protein